MPTIADDGDERFSFLAADRRRPLSNPPPPSQTIDGEDDWTFASFSRGSLPVTPVSPPRRRRRKRCDLFPPGDGGCDVDHMYEEIKDHGRGWIARATGAVDSVVRWKLWGRIASFCLNISLEVREDEYSWPGAPAVDDPSRVYYTDSHNEHPWRCVFGTSEGDGIWMNNTDVAGIIMSASVWFLMIYSALTVTFLSETGTLPAPAAMLHLTICALSLATHAKTAFSDPGAVPQCAVPLESELRAVTFHAMCRWVGGWLMMDG